MKDKSTVTSFTRPINSCEDFGVSVLKVRRSVRLRQDACCAGDLSQFRRATTINTESYLVV